MVEQRTGKKPTKKEVTALINKGYDSLDVAIDNIINAANDQGLEILVDIFKLAKKVAAVYRVAYLARVKDLR